MYNIFNAKFDEQKILMNTLKENKFQFSAICIQESWLWDKDTIKHLKWANYTPITQCKICSPEGGLVIYLHDKDDQAQFTNYRPISLLPAISKIFERVITIFMTSPQNKHYFIVVNMALEQNTHQDLQHWK